MGKFDFDLPTTLVDQVTRLSNVDEIAPKMIEAATPVLEKQIKSELSKHRRTGLMADSVKKTKAAKNKYGWYLVVRPTGKSSKYIDATGKLRNFKEPVRNMEIMAHLEYGTSNQPPRPILTKAIKDATPQAIEAMRSAFEKEAKKS